MVGTQIDVLVLTSTYPRHPTDPVGRFLVELLAELPQRLAVLCPDDGSRGENPLPHVLRRTFARPGVFYGAGAPANLRRARGATLAAAGATAAFAAAALRAAHGVPVVWSHWALPAGLVGALCRRLLGCRHVLLLHSADVWLLERLRLGARLARWIAGGSDRIFAVSAPLAARFERLSHRRPEVLGCGVHAGVAAQEPRASGAPGRVGLLCRLVPGKGVLELLGRAAELRGELHVAGDGPLRDEVARRCARRPNTRFHGALVGAEKRAYLASLDVFAAPYAPEPGGQPEGLPVAILEALAAGLPTVAYRDAAPGGPLREGGNALLVPPGDVGGLLAAAQDLLDDPTRRAQLGARARADAEPHLLEHVAPRWAAVLDDLLAAPGARGVGRGSRRPDPLARVAARRSGRGRQGEIGATA